MKKFICSIFLFGAVMSANTLDISLHDAGNGAIDATGRYYVGPYHLTINGVVTAAMCMDDFVDNNIGDTWSATETRVNSSDFSNTYLGNAGKSYGSFTVPSSMMYKAEAYLFSQIIKPGADQADLQEAAWLIMDPNNPDYRMNAGVTRELFQLAANYSSFDTSGYSIISDVTKYGKQEFVVASSTPEPASFALFGGGLLAVAAARFSRRKKTQK